MIKLLTLTIFIIIFSYLVSAQWGYGRYQISPAELLENEWVIFGGIFALVFAVVYISLSSAFRKKSKNKMFPWLQEVEHNVGATVVISLVIAFFIAATLVRKAMLSNYLGEAVTAWVTIIVIVVMIILLIPFYKALKTHIGSGFSFIIIFSGLWVILRILNPSEFLPWELYTYELEQVYEFLRSYIVLIIIIVIGIILAAVKKK